MIASTQMNAEEMSKLMDECTDYIVIKWTSSRVKVKYTIKERPFPLAKPTSPQRGKGVNYHAPTKGEMFK